MYHSAHRSALYIILSASASPPSTAHLGGLRCRPSAATSPPLQRPPPPHPTPPFSAHPSACLPINARLNCCCQDLPQCGLHRCGDDIVDLQLRWLHPEGLPQFSRLMALESWKICLSYQDENQQHKVLEGFMDRKDISFYEIIKLIEEVGFSPAYDFLYYRKKYPRGRGYLVRIDNDSHVSKMISEHTNEKRVQLYVFREEANIDVAPSDPQHEDDEPATRLEDDVFDEGAVKTRTATSQSTMRRSKRLNVVQSRAEYTDEDYDNTEQSRLSRASVLETQDLEDNEDQVDHRDDRLDNISGDGKRRGTSLPAVWNMPDGERIVVKCNNLGQPIGDEGGVLGKFLGTIARLGGYCPLDKKDWRNVKKDGGAETILQCVQTKFLYPAKCDKWILKTTGRDWRRFKAGLKKKIFSANKKRKSLYKLCPQYVDSDQWRELVKFWKSREGKAVSEKNKTSRTMVKTSHTAGTKSFARWAEDLRQEDPEKKQPHRAKVYLATHRKPKKARDKNKLVVELEKVITEHPELAQSDQGRVAWKGDALHKVLGNEKPGQVHGMGLLPVPNQVYGRKPRYLKNINVTTTNGSSHDGEADAREEIAKLKKQIEEQDKIIDALRNSDGVHGASEMAMENFQTVGNGESHPEVLHNNKRKRVHANGPNEECTVIKPRDTVMNKTHPHQHGMHEDNDIPLGKQKHHLEQEGCSKFSYQEPSSPAHHVCNGEMRQIKENMFGNLTKQNKQITQDKSAVHVSSKQKRSPSMEVGTKVILKSSIYPNKRHVAHATILGCKSNIMVGGVELGRQFIEVQVDQPIEECELLVRERENCRTIGDAFTFGLTIAWPSACIERSNG